MTDKPKLALVAALSRNHVIGKDNQLLWQLPADMAHFKQLTRDHAVIMGSKTYMSLPERFRPLPQRLNIVLSRASHHDQPSLTWVKDLGQATEQAHAYAMKHAQDTVFVIGGGEIYAHFLPLADRLYLTHIDADYTGDAFFPKDYLDMAWDKTELARHASQNGQPSFRIVQYDRR